MAPTGRPGAVFGAVVARLKRQAAGAFADADNGESLCLTSESQQQKKKHRPGAAASSNNSYSLFGGDGEDDGDECDSRMEDEEDRNPLYGRFSDAMDDADDRLCALRPLAKKKLTAAEKNAAADAARWRIQGRPHRHATVDANAPQDVEMTCEDVYDQLRQDSVDKLAQAVERMKLQTRGALSCDLLRDQKMSKGNQTLAAIRKCLNSFGLTRSQHQSEEKTPHTQKNSTTRHERADSDACFFFLLL